MGKWVNVLVAVITVRRLRNVRLDVKLIGGLYTWKQHEDQNWQRYNRARNLIASHKLVERALLRLNIIRV